MRQGSSSVGLVFALALLSACQTVVDVDDSKCTLLFEAPVVTFPAVEVGKEATLRFKVAASLADCTITALNVQNTDGTAFSAAPLDAAGEVLNADGALVVARDTAAEIAVRYLSLEPGYHTATVTLSVTDALDANPTVDVRGTADTPLFRLYPPIVDFGDVAAHQARSGLVFLDNLSQLDLVIDQGAFTSADDVATSGELTLTNTFPMTIPPGTLAAPIEVRYAPEVDRTLEASLLLKVAQDTFKVSLRSNDCLNGSPEVYDRDGDFRTSCGEDCDDNDPLVYEGAAEIKDGQDNDCDGLTDEDTLQSDDDSDGFCEAGQVRCLDGAVPGDCNDHDAAVNPNVDEVCPSADPVCSDGIDNNCDGDVDGGATDADQDGYTDVGGDCDTADAHVFPGAPETANGKDDDCDGVIDEGTSNFDDDLDGFSEAAGDCDDRATPASLSNPYPGATTSPVATELPDRRDNDCDGVVDEGTYYADDDGDGYAEGDPSDTTLDDRLRDCDDTNAARAPGNREVVGDPAHLDEDCNASTGP
jgi:hypothetical protein